MQGRRFLRCALQGLLASRRALVRVAALLGLFAAPAAPAQGVVEPDALLGLRSGHPRILADAAQLHSCTGPGARPTRSRGSFTESVGPNHRLHARQDA